MEAIVKPDVARVWTRALVLLALVLVTALLTRCPLSGFSDMPVPPPTQPRR